MGRMTGYTQEIANEICHAIASTCKGTKKLCKENQHWPSQDTIFSWLKIHKEFSEQYAQAKRHQVEALVDEMLEIADDSSHDYAVNEKGKVVCNIEHIQRSRLRIDLYKWIACKLVPRVYGDRISAHPGDNVIECVTCSRAKLSQELITQRIHEVLQK